VLRFLRRWQSWVLARSGLILGILILGLGLLLQVTFSPHAIPTEIWKVQRSPAQTLVGRLYRPVQTQPPYPTLFLWHGVSSTKETMELLAIELARAGIAALTFDAGGFGESYSRPYSIEENLADAWAVLDDVNAHPEQFDVKRLGVAGHSMGGATAIALAMESDQIKTTLALGMRADVNYLVPPNLLMGIGLYEQFHPPHLMRSMLHQSTGALPIADRQYGDFQRGNARKLVISPTSDHLMEPFDATLIRETVLWARQALGVTASPLPRLIMPGFLVGWVLTAIGSLLTLGAISQEVARFQPHPRLPTGILLIWVGLWLSLARTGILPDCNAASLILLAAAALPIAHFALRFPHRLWPLLLISGLYSLVILVAYTLVAIGLRFSELLHHPAYWLGIPQLIAQIPGALLYSRWSELKAAVFSSYSQALMPNFGLVLLFLPEVIRPGLVLNWGVTLAAAAAQWFRQPWEIRWVRPSRRSLQLLSSLTLVLILLLIYQAQLGFITWEAARTSFMVLLQLLLLPGLLIVAMVRSPLLQQLEQRCWRSPHPLIDQKFFGF